MSVKGHIDKVTDKYILGWATSGFYSKPLKIHLYIDKRHRKSVFGDRLRAGLVDKGIHHTGYCEYLFNVDDLLEGLEDKLIEVKAEFKDKIYELKGSPVKYHVEKDDIISHFVRGEGRKILLVGLPKSGTSFLTYTIAGCYSQMKIYFEPNSNEALEDFKLHYDICSENEALISKCLYFPNKHSNINPISNLYDKRLWIVRDPRDWMISNFLYMWYRKHNYPPEKYEEALKMVIKKENSPHSVNFIDLINVHQGIDWYIKYYVSAIKTIKNLNNAWCYIKYEDLICEDYSQINEYLDISIQKQGKLPGNLKRVVRSKKYDNWRKWFTKEDLSILKPKLNLILDIFEYDSKDWSLDENPTLDPQIGSEYMRKLHDGELS